ncbi:MAG: hypothetical protein AVO38_11200 [delta proteobacterium ML8_D]|jgi:hypothetical protein|nr:MAG: hypothetical protein AVO38_11200 [delta proteobacterium ML8_D]
MKKRNDPDNSFFAGLFGNIEVEKAPEGFSGRVMSAILAENATAQKNIDAWWLWGGLLFGLIFTGLVVIIFMVDFSFFGNMFAGMELDGQRMISFFNNSTSLFASIAKGFDISGITIFIMLPVAALITIDRLLRRKAGMELPLI